MQDEKSQLQNRERAMKVLRARLYEAELAEQQAELAADRRAQVGTGERAEKIRTYNFPERRVTDHRVKLTAHNLDQLLQGELDEFTAALQDDEKRRRLDAAAVERALMHISVVWTLMCMTLGVPTPCGGGRRRPIARLEPPEPGPRAARGARRPRRRAAAGTLRRCPAPPTG